MTQYVKNLLSDSTVVNQRLLASKKNVRQLLRILYLKYQSFLSLLMFLRFPSKKKNEACAIKSSYLSYTFI